jgi:hypothetical protein
MKVSLPIQEKSIINGELIKKENEKEFNVDTSLASQIRFEAKFPELAQHEDLFGYSKRICAVDSLSAGVIISKMKMLYCWFDTDIEFIDFLKMFDLSDKDYVEKLTSKIKQVFEIIFNGSAEKN